MSKEALAAPISPRRRKSRIAAVMGVIAVPILGATLIASPALAVGSFTEKYTPSLCTETDFSGSTSNTGTTGGSGYTKHGALICPPPGVQLGLQLTRGSTQSQYKTSFTSATVSLTLTGGTGPTHGYHTIDSHTHNT